MNVSIITPTLNSLRTIDAYMKAIVMQNYPHENLEIIIADGGSRDGTLEKIRKYQKENDITIRIYKNRLKTAEAGKAVGIRKVKGGGGVICFLDSDNIIPDPDWIKRMVQPFKESDIVASEPILYTYRKTDSVINRYCALIGMNDPLCMFTGNYDRYCYITGKWTNVKREEIDRGNYFSVKFYENMIPTIGANGFFIRAKELLDYFEGDYLFDIDILWELIKERPEIRIAKVKTGIVHLFCPDTRTFYRKQARRIGDFLFFNSENGRKYPWSRVGKSKIIFFILSCVTVVPLVLQALVGYRRKPDIAAWTYHFVACWITLWVYGTGVIKSFFKKEQVSRKNWRQ